MDGQTVNLSILQDFVPYRGRCFATAHLQPKNCIKRGKGTANHMMALGDWFIAKVKVGSTGSNHITKDLSFGFTTTTIFANVRCQGVLYGALCSPVCRGTQSHIKLYILVCNNHFLGHFEEKKRIFKKCSKISLLAYS